VSGAQELMLGAQPNSALLGDEEYGLSVPPGGKPRFRRSHQGRQQPF
jgi:hypothetical protein